MGSCPLRGRRLCVYPRRPLYSNYAATSVNSVARTSCDTLFMVPPLFDPRNLDLLNSSFSLTDGCLPSCEPPQARVSHFQHLSDTLFLSLLFFMYHLFYTFPFSTPVRLYKVYYIRAYSVMPLALTNKYKNKHKNKTSPISEWLGPREKTFS